jgi:putative membrane protein
MGGTLMNKGGFSWKEAFWVSPGPRSLKSALSLYLKGACMGAADIIPGVSGGTIALITGIYEKLLQAIKSADMDMARKALTFNIKGALARIHIRFLLCLFLGIGTSLLSLARLMNYLLLYHPVSIWSLFFGLIAASVLVVGRRVDKWRLGTAVFFLTGAGAGYFIVNLIPVSTPEDPLFVFFSGMLAICAMILPGLSGAFILLILGKYEFITATLKNPFLVSNSLIILVFCSGCLVGLLGFSRILNYLIDNYHGPMLAFLTGLMAGCMQKIWPWKQVLDISTINGHEHILWGGNILPAAVDVQVVAAAALAVLGFIVVVALEKLSDE